MKRGGERQRLKPAIFWPIFALLFFALTLLALTIATLVKVPETRSMLQVYSAESWHFHDVYGQWPQRIDDFAHNPKAITFIHSKALLSSDSWGHPWVYEPFDSGRGFGIARSLGRDGKPGGSGLDQDIELRFSSVAGNSF
jgi:hypothetical protein